MAIRCALVSLLGLTLSSPAAALVREWRASGVVDASSGPALLPLPAAPGDDFVLEFAYDDAASDLVPGDPDTAFYPLLAMTVSIAGASLEWVGPGTGMGAVVIEVNAAQEDRWGVSGCLTGCSSDPYHEARLNLSFPPDTILSDALTGPPDPTGASVQFGLFSSDLSAMEEATVIATLVSVVPEPSAPWLLATALAALVARGLVAGRASSV